MAGLLWNANWELAGKPYSMVATKPRLQPICLSRLSHITSFQWRSPKHILRCQAMSYNSSKEVFKQQLFLFPTCPLFLFKTQNVTWFLDSSEIPGQWLVALWTLQLAYLFSKNEIQQIQTLCVLLFCFSDLMFHNLFGHPSSSEQYEEGVSSICGWWF